MSQSPVPESNGDSRDPSGFLSEIIGAPVTVKLNSGIVYKGDLQSVDGYMNIALERCKEVSEGRVTRNWGDAFVRGNNVTYISPDGSTMPRHRVRSRVRIHGPTKMLKHGDGEKPQYKPARTVFDDASQSLLYSNVVDEDLFKKKRVPSTEELGDLLKSKLSSSLAAEKVYLEQQRAQNSSPSPQCQYFEPIRPPPPRQGPSHFGKANARLNLPVSPPIVVPKGQRPHQPYDEGLSQPFIKPAPDHKLFGTYYVAPDIFTPKVVQQGFPGPSTCTALTHPLPNEARFLDRTNTAWGKWYAKYPKPEDLPFAATYKGAQESTDQEVWDMHASAHAPFRKPPPPPTSEEEVRQRLDEEKYARAERLRYHTGHCFGALTGFCYPFQGGLVV
ncbi:U4/U6-U5 snRNP complex subunit lsm6 [Didymella keratinophila]|nr:U4/U6-U5 snRNP complex subunit lsm6 [Didymella keratinophila]